MQERRHGAAFEERREQGDGLVGRLQAPRDPVRADADDEHAHEGRQRQPGPGVEAPPGHEVGEDDGERAGPEDAQHGAAQRADRPVGPGGGRRGGERLHRLTPSAAPLLVLRVRRLLRTSVPWPRDAGADRGGRGRRAGHLEGGLRRAAHARPARPGAPSRGELRRVNLRYRCSVCFTEIRMVKSTAEDPDPRATAWTRWSWWPATARRSPSPVHPPSSPACGQLWGESHPCRSAHHRGPVAQRTGGSRPRPWGYLSWVATSSAATRQPSPPSSHQLGGRAGQEQVHVVQDDDQGADHEQREQQRTTQRPVGGELDRRALGRRGVAARGCGRPWGGRPDPRNASGGLRRGGVVLLRV